MKYKTYYNGFFHESVCQSCGASVRDGAKHDKFHDELNAQKSNLRRLATLFGRARYLKGTDS